MSIGDLLHRLDDIYPGRIITDVLPGQATEEDWLRHTNKGQLCELIDGHLVEKPMGSPESALALWLSGLLSHYLHGNDIGFLIGESGSFRLGEGHIRVPDIAFIHWNKTSDGCFPRESIFDLAPDLAIEVLSPSNTHAEMQAKRHDYFNAGCHLIWEVDPELRIVNVYTTPTDRVTLTQSDTLTGGEVLPGFSVPVQRIFEKLSPRE